MSEPVKCGCGGEAEFTDIGSIRCRKCGIETAVHATDNDTIAYWDVAMGAKLREAAALAAKRLDDMGHSEWAEELYDVIPALKGPQT
jgi:hypothetical protein